MARSQRSSPASQSTTQEISRSSDALKLSVLTPQHDDVESTFDIASSAMREENNHIAQATVFPSTSTLPEDRITTPSSFRDTDILRSKDSSDSTPESDYKPATSHASILRNSLARAHLDHKSNHDTSQATTSLISSTESHSPTMLQQFYCLHCKNNYNNMSEHATKEHKTHCCQLLPMDENNHSVPPHKSLQNHTALDVSVTHPTIISPIRQSDVDDGSDSDLSDAPDPYESSLDSDYEDVYGDRVEFMPLPFIYKSTTAYPTDRNSPTSDASDTDEVEKSMSFATLTAIDDFNDSLMGAENMEHDELYLRVENAQQALVMWQEEWLLNEIEVRKLERFQDNDHERQQNVPRQIRNPRQGPVKPDNRLIKGGNNDIGQQGWDWKDKYKQQQQDMIEAFSYGFEYNPHPAKIGLQDPVTQRPGNVVDGSRSLRNRMPTKKLAENDSGGESEEGRPRRTLRGASSRLASEIPEDGRRPLVNLKGKGRALATTRVAQLQKQEGRPGRDSESPERLFPSQRLNNSTLIAATLTNGERSLTEYENEHTTSQNHSEIESKTAMRSGLNSTRKKKKKQPTEKRKAVRVIQLKRPSIRTEDETRILKAFREKKGAWATRAGKDVDVVLNRFDENALLTSSDEDGEEMETYDDNEVSSVSGAIEASNINTNEPISSSGMGIDVIQEGADGKSRTSLNMRDRWRKKKEAESRADTDVLHTERRTQAADADEDSVAVFGSESHVKSRGGRRASNTSTSSTISSSSRRRSGIQTTVKLLSSNDPKAYLSTVDGRQVLTFNVPGLQEVMSEYQKEWDSMPNNYTDNRGHQDNNHTSELPPKGSTSISYGDLKEISEIKTEPDLEYNEEQDEALGGEPLENKFSGEHHVQKSFNTNSPLAAIVNRLEDDNHDALSDTERPAEDEDPTILQPRRASTASRIRLATTIKPQATSDKPARGGARKGAGRKKRTTQDLSVETSSQLAPPNNKRARLDNPKARIVQRQVSSELPPEEDTSHSSPPHKKRKPLTASPIPQPPYPPTENTQLQHPKRSRNSLIPTSNPIPLPRKVSVYEEYLALSSPTHNPLQKRTKRTAALKARRSLLASDGNTDNDATSEAEGDGEMATSATDDERRSETSTSLAPESAAFRAIRPTGKPGVMIKREPKIEARALPGPAGLIGRVGGTASGNARAGASNIGRTSASASPNTNSRGPYMSEYEHFQAIASQSAGGENVLGKRRRRPVSDMNRIMELERAESEAE